MTTHASMRHATALTVFVLAPLLFMQPFGVLPSKLLAGLSLQDVAIPLALASALFFAANRFVISNWSLVVLAFVALTTPSLLTIGTTYGPILIALLGGFFLVVVAGNAIESHRDVHILLRAYLFGMTTVAFFVACALVGLFDVGTVFGHPLLTRGWYALPVLRGTEEITTAFGPYYMVALPIAVFEWLRSRTFKGKVILSILILVFVTELLIVFSRGALLGAMVGCLCVLMQAGSVRVKRTTLAVGVLLSSVVIPVALAPSLFIDLLPEQYAKGVYALLEVKEASTDIHAAVFWAALEAASNAPPWGVGFGNSTELIRQSTGNPLGAHNAFLGITIEFGISAALLFAVFFLRCIYAAWNATRWEQAPERKGSYAVVLGIVLGFFADAFVHETYVNSLMWTFLGMALACETLAFSKTGVIVGRLAWRH